MNSLSFPHETPPPGGELRQLAPGVFWLRMPLPFVLYHINLWLLKDGEGWAVVDTGFALDEVKALWEVVLLWQAGTMLLPIQSVGVMGDERTYEFTVALRAVTSIDGMTADWAHIPYDILALISNEIINKVKGVNRVVYDISSKPPATIEWE